MLLAAGRQRRAALRAAGATRGCALQGLKRVVGPATAVDADPTRTRLLIARPNGASWPSSHPAVLTTFTRVASRELGVGTTRRARPFAPALDLAVGTSRVYSGVHYPSDVASGLLFGRAVARLWPRRPFVASPLLRSARWILARIRSAGRSSIASGSAFSLATWRVHRHRVRDRRMAVRATGGAPRDLARTR
mgnify:CR=1 FL=1